MDVKAISKTLIRNLKTRTIGRVPYDHEGWHDADPIKYEGFYNKNKFAHQHFEEYLMKRLDIKTVLEVGCGTGMDPIKNVKWFKDKEYTGNDFSKECINYCKKNSPFEFISGDFLKININKKFDLVYTHTVIDHIYDIESFISKIIGYTKKYAYINAYSGYFPKLKKHKMNWRDDHGCFYNHLSVTKLKEDLLEIGLTDEEFLIKEVKGGFAEFGNEMQTVIEITKKTS